MKKKVDDLSDATAAEKKIKEEALRFLRNDNLHRRIRYEILYGLIPKTRTGSARIN